MPVDVTLTGEDDFKQRAFLKMLFGSVNHLYLVGGPYSSAERSCRGSKLEGAAEGDCVRERASTIDAIQTAFVCVLCVNSHIRHTII